MRSNLSNLVSIAFTATAVPTLLALTLTLSHATEPRGWINENSIRYSDEQIAVTVGIRIDQVVEVNQRSENFQVVGDFRMEWEDPNLAFIPAPDEFEVRRYQTDLFERLADRHNFFFPTIRVHNQQGRRFSDDSGVVVFPDGKVVFGERFTITLQAPEFDFRAYPFDTQLFYITLDTQWPESVMTFIADKEFSGFGNRLGEEEWVFVGGEPSVSSRTNMFGEPASRITFTFYAHRHIWYYVLRIIIPLLIIVTVSWATFFLRDFSKRVDISGGNLLVFVAFNFTISSDLPRLGYMTFMDVVLAAAFIITGLTVVWNVALRRLELQGREKLARLVDSYTLWLYPGSFLAVILIAWRIYFPDWSIFEILSRF